MVISSPDFLQMYLVTVLTGLLVFESMLTPDGFLTLLYMLKKFMPIDTSGPKHMVILNKNLNLGLKIMLVK